MNKKQSNKDKNIETKKSSSLLGRVFFIAAFIGGVSSYYVYKVVTTPPEIPKVNMNEHWGPYPLDPKPDLSIRPFKIEFSDAMINDLRERLLHRRSLPPPLENVGFSYGFNSNFLTQVLDYWQNKYNFKERERFLNKYNHYKTKIQGLDIHFIRVKPEIADGITVVPLLIMHGWPGSVREFYEIIPLLTTPRPGYKFVFEIIAPSLPGFGFSQGQHRAGLGATDMGVIMHNLMKRLGIDKYYIQGGDAGHSIGSAMATLFPDNVLGFHSNIPMLMNHPLGTFYIILGSLWPSLIEVPELHSRMYPFLDHIMWLIEESGYMHIQATKPDTVGVGLSDSPSGLAAYILEKFSTWTNPEFKKAADGNLLRKFTLTQLLDNVMIYWISNSITTSVRMYAETLNIKEIGKKMELIPTPVPTWGIKFKHELMYQPDFVLKLKYKNYLRSTVVEDGGHFAALENPEIMADDIFEAVNTFRDFHGGGKKETEPHTSPEVAKTIYDFTVTDINGREVSLEKYRGYVVLIVNVASECGLTDTNYNQLNELYEKYGSRGLRILAFPCNQFNGQEPGSPREILEFTKNRGVRFDIFEKIDVNGENAHPLWKFLKRSQPGTLGEFIKWNFSKFIVDKNGAPVERLGPNVNPLDLEPYLAKYW
ncbi:hypothetical protein K1T71_012575 [Dendrolimus kikuchii]|uniref:Uncharacterized protein n=1 Tax=Dendrolimus kikuchii TaxID=765133 RepID=A0ACC1CJS1_9NEOP|nr:hypothetical protein K1T71_012575 [Dendrolimus kikuchii]